MPLSYTATRDLLAQLGHNPKRFLGQNFLVDGNIVRKSLELAQVASGDRVVEVGPGLGTLTRALLATGAEVWAVEKDRRLCEHLRETLGALPGLHLMEGDAVEHPLAGLPEELAATAKIVANLPYAISTPWMVGVLSGLALPKRAVLMLQLEAAERYAAQPGTKAFGAVSIFLQSAYEIAPGHRVAGTCFYPRPDVDSYLLHLVRRERPFVFSTETQAVIRACFQQRRKQLGSLLRGVSGGPLPQNAAANWLDELAAAGFSPKTRPEAVPISLWQKLEAHCIRPLETR
ncbi:16S rRNA methyltransferase [Cephaloticoccus capnophilus]|uniref:Ribosomal RNA small subunit methyltransferase A n=1 Tax=Cephaloticoccus capnophilus TaxID=1548208 RepID=A0A139SIF9_9BACT|nr:16S rRNA (adenine(1518)-N(6)/adenine(1519)-N(6))-dimethyltransferase RsmA [Cephaloticoccus capnophilus]KXU34337.1 16S rRNA methyltransferase [Cephaloticoccus capnophilus]